MLIERPTDCVSSYDDAPCSDGLSRHRNPSADREYCGVLSCSECACSGWYDAGNNQCRCGHPYESHW
jgi:hypothetical protein